MPELPEVETVRRSLTDRIVGHVVRSVRVHRPDVVHGPKRPMDLLRGHVISRLERLGKQLVLIGNTTTGTDARCVCVHFGMSGSLRYVDRASSSARDPHVHVTWKFLGGGQLTFRDPRRFGGLWSLASTAALHRHHWKRLGEDALCITPMRLHRRLAATGRSLKAALLDQNLIAGLGNIYADELLFACGLYPLRRADSLTPVQVQHLVQTMRRLLCRAIKAGGSTIRDHANINGDPGRFQHHHQVYGRRGQACYQCQSRLAVTVIAGRSTVFCCHCQSRGYVHQ